MKDSGVSNSPVSLTHRGVISLEKQNRKENDPKEFRGKAYTLYEAKQRQMETAMRAQCEKIRLLQHGGADPDEVMLQKAKYQGQLNEYAAFSRKMGLEEERERIYIDGRGRIAKNTKIQNSLFSPEMIQNAAKEGTDEETNRRITFYPV